MRNSAYGSRPTLKAIMLSESIHPAAEAGIAMITQSKSCDVTPIKLSKLQSIGLTSRLHINSLGFWLTLQAHIGIILRILRLQALVLRYCQKYAISANLPKEEYCKEMLDRKLS